MVYILVFIAVVATAATVHCRRDCGERPSLPPRLAVWLAPAGLVTALVGLRRDTGTDYQRYLDHFGYISEGAGPLFREPLYTAGAALVARLGGSAEVYLFLLAALTNLVVFFVVRREGGTQPALLAAGVFGLGLVLAQVNLVRQSVAVAFVILALAGIGRIGLLRYTAIMAVAAGFHYAAALFYPLYWLARLRTGLFHVHVLCTLSLLLFFFPGLVLGPLEAVATDLPGAAADIVERIVERGAMVDTGLGVLLTFSLGYAGLCLFHLSAPPRTLREQAVANLALYAVALDAALANFWVLHRLSDYLVVFIALLFVHLAERSHEPTGRRVLVTGVVTAFAVRYSWDLASGTHGALPYASLVGGS